jgi:hypothetical protein
LGDNACLKAKAATCRRTLAAIPIVSAKFKKISRIVDYLVELIIVAVWAV